jgi:hypothetical protein
MVAVVGEDGDQVVLAEAPELGRPAQRLVHLAAAEQHRQLGGLGHLGPDPRGTAGGRASEPALGALADGQEGALVLPCGRTRGCMVPRPLGWSG